MVWSILVYVLKKKTQDYRGKGVDSDREPPVSFQSDSSIFKGFILDAFVCTIENSFTPLKGLSKFKVSSVRFAMCVKSSTPL